MDNKVAVKRTASVPVILDFVPTSCSIHINQADDNSVPPSIDMRLRLSDHTNLSTPEGKHLESSRWGITIYRGATDSERVKALDAIGLLGYYPATKDDDYSVKEGCSAWAHLDAASFDLLQGFVMSGRMPSALRIHAQGKRIRHGYAPDGSEVVWDIATEATGSTDSDDWVAVNQLELSLGVAEQDQGEDPIADALRPINVADLRDLEQALTTSLDNYLSSIKSWLGWLLAVVAAIAVLVFFASWHK